MTVNQALRLSADQTLTALDDIDLPQLVAERLLTADRGVTPVLLKPDAAGPPAPHRGAQTAVENPGTGAVALLPTAALQTIWAAGLTLVASRLLVAPGVLTAAVFGSGPGLELQVSVLARCLPALSHVTVPQALTPGPGGRGVLAELDLAGIGVATVPDPRQAALGANLLVFTVSAQPAAGIGPPARGTLLVNAAGRDLPGYVLDRIDRVYLDDPRLVAQNQHRESFRARRAGPPNESGPLLGNREGWYRRHQAGYRAFSVAAGLGDVLAGSKPGRTSSEEILLAEFLGPAVLDAVLAWRLWQSAAARGLGDRVDHHSGSGRGET